MPKPPAAPVCHERCAVLDDQPRLGAPPATSATGEAGALASAQGRRPASRSADLMAAGATEQPRALASTRDPVTPGAAVSWSARWWLLSWARQSLQGSKLRIGVGEFNLASRTGSQPSIHAREPAGLVDLEGWPARGPGCIRGGCDCQSRAMPAGAALLDQVLGVGARERTSGSSRGMLSSGVFTIRVSMFMRSSTLRGGWSRRSSGCPLVSSPDHALDAGAAICDVSRLPLVRALAAASAGGRA